MPAAPLVARADAAAPAAPAGNTAPIAPVPVPAARNEEADVVVVGTGGGLVAAAYTANSGKKMVVLEKAPVWGGTSKETDIFSVICCGRPS